MKDGRKMGLQKDSRGIPNRYQMDGKKIAEGQIFQRKDYSKIFFVGQRNDLLEIILN